MMLTLGLTSLLVVAGVLRRGHRKTRILGKEQPADRPTQALVTVLYLVYVWTALGGGL